MKKMLMLVGCVLCLVGCEKTSNEVISYVGSNEDWLGTYFATEVAGQSYSTLTIQTLSENQATQTFSYQVSDLDVNGQIEDQTIVHEDQIGVVDVSNLQDKDELALKINVDGREETLILKSTTPKTERFRWSLLR